VTASGRLVGRSGTSASSTSTSVAAPPQLGRDLPLLDLTTVRMLHQAVRAGLRLEAGLDPQWSWTGHAEREFLRAARGHHVCGLIASHSAALGMPAGLRGGLARTAERVALTSLAHAGLLRQVRDRLAAAAIPALFVKGLAVEAQTGRQLGDRGAGDLDVWVPAEHVEAAIAALEPDWALPDGYPRPGPSWAWRHWLRWGSELPLLGPITVDLHWQLHCVRDNLPDFPAAWAAREEVVVGHHALPTLSRGHAVAHACRHAQTDRWRVLRSLVDIHLLLAVAGDRPEGAPPALPGRTIAVVDRSIGLPRGVRAAASLPARRWAAVLDEQRHLGTHADRIQLLSRPAYLRRVLGRLRGAGRRPMHDALGLLWFLALAPPHESGRITTTSTTLGVGQGLSQRIRYERARAGRRTVPD